MKPWRQQFGGVVRSVAPPVLLDLVWRVRKRGSCTCQLEVREVGELLPGIEDVPVTIPCSQAFRSAGALPLTELVVLSAICRHVKPETVFEIGTFTGSSTLTMAKHTPDETRIFTLDLDPADRGRTEMELDIGDIQGQDYTVGVMFRGTAQEQRITQLYGDSVIFDFGPYDDLIDLVFVDGNHSYENVGRDSESALRMLRPGGVVIWDDYQPTVGPGVVRYLNEIGAGRGIVQIAGTRFAAYVERGGED